MIDDIMKGAESAHKASEERKCKCGFSFEVVGQGLTFSKEDLCFFDEMDLKCPNCGIEETIKIPQHHLNTKLKGII